jgi:hypothetical protein
MSAACLLFQRPEKAASDWVQRWLYRMLLP